jgi:hypothetical protein
MSGMYGDSQGLIGAPMQPIPSLEPVKSNAEDQVVDEITSNAVTVTADV